MYKEAVLGSPNAEFVVIEMMDYTCPHCRKMHTHIREAMERYGDQLAVVIMPVPLELTCNKLVAATDPLHRGACKIARTSLAVAEVDPSRFIDFHNFLLENEEKAPTAAQAVVRAFRLVDRRELTQRGSSKEIDARIQKNIQLYSALANERRPGNPTFGLPVQILGDTVLSGGDMTTEEMFDAWEKAIDIKPE
jgi:protein-disulfide isomerase